MGIAFLFRRRNRQSPRPARNHRAARLRARPLRPLSLEVLEDRRLLSCSLVMEPPITLPTNDLIYDPNSQMIYASVPGIAGAERGNTITAIDPVTGAIGQSVWVGSEPGKLAISDDGHYLYAALNGANFVRRFDIPNMSADISIPLGVGLFAEDLQVVPGSPQSVAVERRVENRSPRDAGVAVYDDAVQRPRVAFGSNSIAYSTSPDRLYGYHSEITDFSFNRMAVDQDGVTTIDSGPSSIFGFNVTIKFDAGLVYSSTGKAIDPETRLLVGSYEGTGFASAFAPDSANDRIYYLSGNQLQVYQETTFVRLCTFNLSSGGGSLIRWGGDGLAYRNGQQVFLMHVSSDADPSASVPFAWSQTAGTENSQGAGAASAGFVDATTSAPGDGSGGLTYALASASNGALPVEEGPVITTAAGPSDGCTLQIQTALSLPTNDLIYDPFSQMIYASVPGRAGAERGNTITVIDPTTGQIGPSIPIGSEPGKLAISDDGEFLYVALKGANEVRRFDIPTLTADIHISLAPGLFAEDLQVIPGSPHSVAVERFRQGISPRDAGVAIYDDDVQRPIVAFGSNSIAYSDSPDILYGYHSEITDFSFNRMAVDDSGVRVTDSGPSSIFGFNVTIKFDAGLIYSSSGRVIDPQTRLLLGTYAGVGFGSSFASDSANDRIYYLSGNELQVYDEATYVRLCTFQLPSGGGSLIRWGDNGLAYHSDNQVFLMTVAS